jgi:hypothetical protein
MLDGLSSIVVQQCKQAVVDSHSNVFCCLRTSTDIVSRVWKSPSADVRVFGYGLLLVGRPSLYREIAREACEFIPWTEKTFYRRG